MLIDNETSAKVSVIIPTLNAGPEFRELLRRLWNQTCRPYEIVVIDSESTDGTAEAGRELGATLLDVKRSEFDHGGTRNRAAEAASGDILMFMTQDAMPHNDRLIEELIKPLVTGDEPVAAAYARQLARPDASLPERLAREANYPEHSGHQSYRQLKESGIKTFFCSNVCAAYRRDVFVEMGRFQEPVIFNEDLFMAAKCILSGYEVAYRAEAMVVHSHNYTVRQQFKRFFDNGVSMRLNAWITAYSSVGGAGSRLVRHQLQGLAAAGQWHLMPKLLAESVAKLLGYKLGLHHRRLPPFIVSRISMHPLIWDHIRRHTPGAKTGGDTLNQ